jgi:hypothetical protein
MKFAQQRGLSRLNCGRFIVAVGMNDLVTFPQNALLRI